MPAGTGYVGAGTYAESVALPVNVALVGTNRDTAIITSSGNVVSMAGTNSRLREVTVTPELREKGKRKLKPVEEVSDEQKQVNARWLATPWPE